MLPTCKLLQTSIKTFFLHYHALLDIHNIIVCAAGTATCASGRLFFGSLDDTLASQVNCTGIYIEQTRIHNERPLFKHEDRDVYLHYNSAGYWAVAAPLDDSTSAALPLATDVNMRVRSVASRPDWVRGSWTVRQNRSWVEQELLAAVCVGASFAACESGKLRLTETSVFSHGQSRVMGLYLLRAGTTHDNRPVYQHETGSKFLFHQRARPRGVWVIGDMPPKATNAFADDFATRPEFVIHAWKIYTGSDFVSVDIHMRCEKEDDMETTASRSRLLPPPPLAVTTAVTTAATR